MPAKFEAIARELRASIAAGELRPGERLPSQRDLADRYGVAFLTARRAVFELMRQGLVQTDGRRGTFVAPRDGHPVTGLVVDDEAGVRTLLRTMLELNGARVIEAEEGGAALARLRAGGIDRLFTDLRMPNGMSGLDLIRAIRLEGIRVPIVAVTNFPDDLMELDRLDSWPLIVVRKPFRMAQIEEALGLPVGRRPGERESPAEAPGALDRRRAGGHPG